jgi:hypothetical protein
MFLNSLVSPISGLIFFVSIHTETNDCQLVILYNDTLEGVTNKGVTWMSWIYWVKLYESKFQAGCLAKRMEEDWWIYGYECPNTVEVFRSKKGRFGVRYIL